MSEEESVLAVRRVDLLPEAPLAVGKSVCSMCKREVWIAQASYNLILKKPTIRIICETCLPGLEEEFDNAAGVPGGMTTLADVEREQPELFKAVMAKVKK